MPVLKRPINSKKVNSNIKLSSNGNEGKIKFDWSCFIFTSIQYKYFTNFFKDESHYINVMSSIYRKIIPWLENKTFIEIERENKHCHLISSEEKEGKFIQNILSKYIEKFPFLKIESFEEEGDDIFYQIGLQSSVRLIGKRIGNKFFLYFIDCYHLIYRNEIFDEDYKNYYYEPNNYRENIKIISFNEVLSECEECLECKNLEKLTN
ncbi:hypothetical protein [Fusobacterium sp.]|uniref:hypothetical protein n=1 Tax=Fusobacterium sp. TaxID=68766 RepID=UPI0026037B3C|nr:hypothetical protein [Fusobacterium sp.]